MKQQIGNTLSDLEDRTKEATQRLLSWISERRRLLKRRRNKYLKKYQQKKKEFKKRGTIGAIAFVGLHFGVLMWLVTMGILVLLMVQFILAGSLIFAAIVSFVTVILSILGLWFAGLLSGATAGQTQKEVIFR